MHANYRDQHYFVYLRPGEAEKINRNSPLVVRLFEEVGMNKIDTGKKLRLSLGGNRKGREGIDASLYSPKKRNIVYVKVNRNGKEKLIANEPVQAKYRKGMVTIETLSEEFHEDYMI